MLSGKNKKKKKRTSSGKKKGGREFEMKVGEKECSTRCHGRGRDKVFLTIKESERKNKNSLSKKGKVIKEKF